MVLLFVGVIEVFCVVKEFGGWKGEKIKCILIVVVGVVVVDLV